MAQTFMSELQEARNIVFHDSEKAFLIADKVVTETIENPNFQIEAALGLLIMGISKRYEMKLPEVYRYAEESFNISQKIEDAIGMSEAANLIGIVYFYYSAYEQALSYFLKAEKYLHGKDNPIILSRIYNNLGEVYRETGNDNEALEAYLRALELSKNEAQKLTIGIILENMGEVYFRKSDLDNAYEYLMKSHEILSELNVISTLSEVENRIGRIYFQRKEYDQAKSYYDLSLQKAKLSGEKYYWIQVLIDLAKYYQHFFDNEEFLNYLHEAIQLAESMQARKPLSLIYKMLSDYYEEEGQFELALEYFKKFHQVEQAIESTTISQKMEILKMEVNRMFTGQEIEKISIINEQLESEIKHQQQLLQELETTNLSLSDKAYVDELTNVQNRRAIMDYLYEYWGNDVNNEEFIAFLVIDIDYFKRYNDTLGHMQGDICLHKVAKCLESNVAKKAGYFARFGGEEFVCFLHNTSKTETINFAQHLCREVENLPLSYEWEGNSYPVTISIGVSLGERSNFDKVDQLYKVADDALYRSKNEGRNRVSW